jgi:hypothetical protein
MTIHTRTELQHRAKAEHWPDFKLPTKRRDLIISQPIYLPSYRVSALGRGLYSVEEFGAVRVSCSQCGRPMNRLDAHPGYRACSGCEHIARIA